MTLTARAAEFASHFNRQAGVSQALSKIAQAAGQGAAAFLKVATGAEKIAAQMDRDARQGRPLPSTAGLIVSIKDLFDIAGEVTTAGSVLLRDAAPATRDAEAVHRLKQAGFIAIGRTNMTEFAFSGLGLNPHYGTPLNPYDRKTGRIPGGSSSGAAVSVTDGMCDIALGTDTGGSCRIPAALCGLVGFKPTARRIPQAGVMPLSPTLDSVGSLGHSVACCGIVDAVLSGEPLDRSTATSMAGITFGVPTSYVFDDIDGVTARSFDRARARVEASGIAVVDIDLPELHDIPAINGKGGFAAREAYLFHAHWIAAQRDDYDPRVLIRILKGEAQTDADYAILKDERASLIERVAARLRGIDALMMPTVPRIAPTLAELESDEAFGRINLMMLRNPTIANMLDQCAISIPCHSRGEAPVGLMLIGKHGHDHRLLQYALHVERILGDGNESC
ncbi:MAG: amidase [Pseudolabrys sp.]